MSEIDVLENELRIASTILEWEMGDIWGHVATRIPGEDSIAVKIFRPAEEPGVRDWFVRYDYDLNKLSGVGTVPMEAAIYSEVFKARPDATAAMHSHAPMCVALSMANRTVVNMHQQSKRFGEGVPVYPDPIFIIDPQEGADLAKVMGDAPAVIIRGHGIVTVGKTIDEATMAALYIERTAKMLAVSYLMGFEGPTPDFIASMQATAEKMAARGAELGRGDRPASAHSAEWNYYADKIHRGEPWNRGWV